MILEEAIRQRSYLIWLRESCPDGNSLHHWLRAKAELEAEQRAFFPATGEWRRLVMPRLPISRPPQRVMSERIPRDEGSASASAARR